MRWWRKTKVEQVHGGDLKPGDIVLVAFQVKHIDQWEHPIATPVHGGYWHVGDQEIWTWGGEHSAGIGTAPTIHRVVNP